MDQGIMTLITVAIVLAAAAFAIWVLYTVIWRAVRRGMQEFERAQSAVPAMAVAPRLATAGRFTRHATAGIVPDYPPREWV